MMIQVLKKRIVADKSVAHFCLIGCSIVAGVVLVTGIRRLAEFDLPESDLFLAMTGTLVLTGVFIILGFQCRAWRRAMGAPASLPAKCS